MKTFTVLVLLGFIHISLYAADARAGASKENQSKQSSELGTPAPGSVSDQESTVKQRNPAKDQTTEQSSQMTLGGAKYVVTGEVLKVDGKYFFVKDAESGDEVRLVVNNDTHIICATSAGGEKASIGKGTEQGQHDASKQQMAQGQRKDETAAGSGFQMGSGSDCFKAGDKVKAEVSDMGTVTTLRYAAEEKASETAKLRPAEGEGIPDTADKSPKPEQLKKGTEHAVAPGDLREETSGEPTKGEPTKQAKADTSMAKECRDCEVVRGRVLKVEDEFLTVRDRSKREVRLHMDKTTMIGQRNMKDEPFKEGDRVEAYVTPKGHAHSISLMRGQGGIPGDPDAGG
jgi:hypothetical protein